MWLRWFPWKLLVSRAARARGLIDPWKILSRLEGFAQPLEGKVPLELIRAGLVFHSRGLLNTGAIQHNLDWIWPFWVERQYDPTDESFIPRAFSITHVNLTHRNWTAVGVPGCKELPIVDPRGLVTPFWDGWSLDAWVVARDGRRLVPSRLDDAGQSLDLDDGVAVVTRSAWNGMELLSRAEVDEKGGLPACRLSLTARSGGEAVLVVALRPYNPEGVSFVEEVRLDRGSACWRVGRHQVVAFDPPADRYGFSDYHSGDIHTRLFETDDRAGIRCKVGMATAAALYAIDGNAARQVLVNVPLEPESPRRIHGNEGAGWKRALAGTSILRLPEKRMQFLFDAAVRSLVLHSPGDVYPGPYTYKRFWFRDAAFILHALMCAGLADRAERVLDTFPGRQTHTGLFHSQEGEWDSNGEALWILSRYCELTGRGPKPEWRRAIERGALWISRNRLPAGQDERYGGLLPPGFSAEHLGPNDYYYWDDFWGVAGLRAAAGLLESLAEERAASGFREEADRFQETVERSLARVALRLGRPAMPASPTRRLDSGAVGSLAAGYPLKLFGQRDARLLDTAEFLLARCLVNGGFYQDIIHSGMNPYLTLHLAQVLLRAGDPRASGLVRTVADLASPTGQWPEAVHPRTGGGCMGDGHHVWASAEWVLMLRNGFLREEGDGLILASGILPEWLEPGAEISFGPAPSSFGEVSVAVLPRREEVEVQWNGSWRGLPPPIEVRLPGFDPVAARPGDRSILFTREGIS
ncbi:MAG: hypothetical protein C3F14_05945 [Deltaproteobacteria bacterium]|nr:MAG: hypothetical protein C3F14_05945 [Deltaproteobacteria bacterium]